MELLLILIIIFFILPWVFRQIMPSLLRWFIRRQTRRFMNGAFPGGMPGAGGDPSDGNRQQQQQPRRSRRKKIDPSVGEYIEFTEVKGSTATAAAPANVKVESQISDIEWEDLP